MTLIELNTLRVKLPFLKNQRGFTLIELLVAISIVAVLTAILSANFVGARQRARDAQRKASLLNIQAALELYRSDNGNYPIEVQVTNQNNILSNCGEAFESPTGAVYMKQTPCDPSRDLPFMYFSSNGLEYNLYACLENAEDQDAEETPDPNVSTHCQSAFGMPAAYRLTSP